MTSAKLLLLASLLAPGAERVGDVRAVADGIVDALSREPARLWDEDTDAAVMLVYAWRESGFRARAVGDGGRARGAWQLWYVPESVGFDPMQSARAWYERALAGKRLWPSDPLQGLSGGGQRGAWIAAQRVKIAKELLEKKP